MNNFKDGDKILCVKNDMYENLFTVGKEYTVKGNDSQAGVMCDAQWKFYVNHSAYNGMFNLVSNTIGYYGFGSTPTGTTTQGVNSSKFKAGDVVRFLGGTIPAASFLFTIGKEYTCYPGAFNIVSVNDDRGSQCWVNEHDRRDFFELVTTPYSGVDLAQKFQIGDKVKYAGNIWTLSLSGLTGTILFVPDGFTTTKYLVDFGDSIKYHLKENEIMLIEKANVASSKTCSHKNKKWYIGLCNKFQYCADCNDWKGPETLIHE